MAKIKNETKVITNECRLSWCHIFEPAPVAPNSETKKYSVTLLIPKSDTDTVEKLKEAMANAANRFREKNGQNSLPPKPKRTLHDGDGQKEDGTEFGPECKGMFVLKVSSQTPPGIVDGRGRDITDSREVYSGCWAKASITWAGYSANGNKGLTAYLNGIQKVRDDEPLAGGGFSKSDFDYDEDEDWI